MIEETSHQAGLTSLPLGGSSAPVRCVYGHEFAGCMWLNGAPGCTLSGCACELLSGVAATAAAARAEGEPSIGPCESCGHERDEASRGLEPACCACACRPCGLTGCDCGVRAVVDGVEVEQLWHDDERDDAGEWSGEQVCPCGCGMLPCAECERAECRCNAASTSKGSDKEYSESEPSVQRRGRGWRDYNRGWPHWWLVDRSGGVSGRWSKREAMAELRDVAARDGYWAACVVHARGLGRALAAITGLELATGVADLLSRAGRPSRGLEKLVGVRPLPGRVASYRELAAAAAGETVEAWEEEWRNVVQEAARLTGRRAAHVGDCDCQSCNPRDDL